MVTPEGTDDPHEGANGDWPVKPKMPLIPGHEGVGLSRRALRRPWPPRWTRWAQYAKIFGAHTVAGHVVEDKLQLAKELGADYTINARTDGPVQAINDLGAADVAIGLAAAPMPFEQAYGSLARGGRARRWSAPRRCRAGRRM